MPTLSIDLTANQAQRLAAALGVATNADAVAIIKGILKERVKSYEASQAANVANDAAKIQVDADFGGF